MGADGTGRRVDDLFVKNKIIRDEIKKNVQQRVAAAARGIPKGLYRHHLPERPVEKVDKCKNPPSQHGRKFREGIPMI